MESHSDLGYTSVLKQRLGIIGKLHALGVNDKFASPTLVLAGSQGSGKSSLVNAISGINVPRDDETCNRCPIQYRLTDSTDEWSAQVSIRREYDQKGSRLGKIQETSFGPTISNTGDVEMRLRRAQAAILVPEIEDADFLTKPEAELQSISQEFKTFSKNTICVDISGPGLIGLSFVDLPGLVQTANCDSENVEELVLSHMRGNRLILMVLSMSDEFDIQKVVHLARRVDPDGQRTIGVLTKPDLLAAGASQVELWQDVLGGRRHALRHGYYCTMQRRDRGHDAGITHNQARAKEKQFFASTSPWSTTSFPSPERFGIDNLILYVSRILVRIIDDILPPLDEGVSQQILDCSRRLDFLSAPLLSDPPAYILSLITRLTLDCQKLVEGVSDPALVQQNGQTYAIYKDAIRGSAPFFVPVPTAQDVGGPVHPGDIALEEWDSSIRGSPSYLQDVRRHLRTFLGRELWHNVPYPAKVTLIRNFQVDWHSAVNTCLHSVSISFEQALSSLVDVHCGRFDNLKSSIVLHMQDLFRSRAEATLQQLTFLLKVESSPYTQQGHELDVLKNRYLKKFKDIRTLQVRTANLTLAQANTSSLLDTSVSACSPAAPSQSTASLIGHTQEIADSTRTASPVAQIPSEVHNSSTSTTPPDRPAGSTLALPSTQVTEEKTSAPSRKDGRKGKRSVKQSFASPQGTAPPPAWPVQDKNQHQSDFLNIQGPGFLHSSNVSSSIDSGGIGPFGNMGGLNAFQSPHSPYGFGAGPEPVPREQLENEVIVLLTHLGMGHVTREDLAKFNPSDDYDEELKLMADVRAYFDISHKRIMDYVPMTIDSVFLYPFAESLQTTLIQNLGIGGADSDARCAVFLVEHPGVAVERAELETLKWRLESVKEELQRFRDLR